MRKSSLEKWVDELQAQIDAVKRDIAGIPSPAPPAPDPEYTIFSCGHATMAITDFPYEESNDEDFSRVAAHEFDEVFDTENFDYYINFDFFSVELLTPLSYYATTNCMILHDEAQLFSDDVMPVFSRAKPQGTETCAVSGIVTVQFIYDESGVKISVISDYGDGRCIAGDTGATTIDYMIVAKKKTETTKKRKTKNRRK